MRVVAALIAAIDTDIEIDMHRYVSIPMTIGICNTVTDIDTLP